MQGSTNTKLVQLSPARCALLNGSMVLMDVFYGLRIRFRGRLQLFA